MPRGLILAAVFVSSACAAIWPDRLSDDQRQSATALQSSDAQSAEYGLESVERADYGKFQVTAWRYKDITGAYSASLEPSAKGAFRVGNYLVSCEGRCPKNLAALADASLPHVSHGSLPPLPPYFVSRNLIPHSERYIVGPVGLAANAGEIPVSAALFDLEPKPNSRTIGPPVVLSRS